MKLVMIYNSSCDSCLPYIDAVKAITKEQNLDYESFDVNDDIFSSIHHVVNCRICIDRTINQLPLLIVYKDNEARHAIVGTYEIEEFKIKLKDVFL